MQHIQSGNFYCFPLDIWQVIFSFLSVHDQLLLSQCSSVLYQGTANYIFSDPDLKAVNVQKKRLLYQLMHEPSAFHRYSNETIFLTIHSPSYNMIEHWAALACIKKNHGMPVDFLVETLCISMIESKVIIKWNVIELWVRFTSQMEISRDFVAKMIQNSFSQCWNHLNPDQKNQLFDFIWKNSIHKNKTNLIYQDVFVLLAPFYMEKFHEEKWKKIFSCWNKDQANSLLAQLPSSQKQDALTFCLNQIFVGQHPEAVKCSHFFETHWKQLTHAESDAIFLKIKQYYDQHHSFTDLIFLLIKHCAAHWSDLQISQLLIYFRSLVHNQDKKYFSYGLDGLILFCDKWEVEFDLIKDIFEKYIFSDVHLSLKIQKLISNGLWDRLLPKQKAVLFEFAKDQFDQSLMVQQSDLNNQERLEKRIFLFKFFVDHFDSWNDVERAGIIRSFYHFYLLVGIRIEGWDEFIQEWIDDLSKGRFGQIVMDVGLFHDALDWTSMQNDVERSQLKILFLCACGFLDQNQKAIFFERVQAELIRPDSPYREIIQSQIEKNWNKMPVWTQEFYVQYYINWLKDTSIDLSIDRFIFVEKSIFTAHPVYKEQMLSLIIDHSKNNILFRVQIWIFFEKHWDQFLEQDRAYIIEKLNGFFGDDRVSLKLNDLVNLAKYEKRKMPEIIDKFLLQWSEELFERGFHTYEFNLILSFISDWILVFSLDQRSQFVLEVMTLLERQDTSRQKEMCALVFNPMCFYLWSEKEARKFLNCLFDYLKSIDSPEKFEELNALVKQVIIVVNFFDKEISLKLWEILYQKVIKFNFLNDSIIKSNMSLCQNLIFYFFLLSEHISADQTNVIFRIVVQGLLNCFDPGALSSRNIFFNRLVEQDSISLLQRGWVFLTVENQRIVLEMMDDFFVNSKSTKGHVAIFNLLSYLLLTGKLSSGHLTLASHLAESIFGKFLVRMVKELTDFKAAPLGSLTSTPSALRLNSVFEPLQHDNASCEGYKGPMEDSRPK